MNLNFSKSGVGVSAGVRGARVSAHSSGRRTVSAGIPGSGIGYQKSWKAGAPASSGRRGAVAPPPAPPPKPGLLAPAYEKAFYKAVQAYSRGDIAEALRLFQEAAARDAQNRAASDDLFVGILAAQSQQPDIAIAALERVVTGGIALPDELMRKYVAEAEIDIRVTDHAKVTVPLGNLAAALTLVECYEHVGRLDDAIGLVQQLLSIDEHPFLVLSLCDLLAQQRAWDELADLAAGTRNEDDVTLQIVVFQAQALAELQPDAALEVCKEALRARKRDPELLKEARYVRARVNARLGRKAQAKKDLAQIYADDPGYRDVAELLDAA